MNYCVHSSRHMGNISNRINHRSWTLWRMRQQSKNGLLYGIYYVPGAILSVFPILNHLFLIRTYKISTLLYFRKEEMEEEAQRV